MGLNIGLVADHQSELVAEFVESVGVRVVAHAHGVEIVLLHEDEVGQHGFLGHGLAAPRVVLVEVGARDDARDIVQEEEALGRVVRVALGRDLCEQGGGRARGG